MVPKHEQERLVPHGLHGGINGVAEALLGSLQDEGHTPPDFQQTTGIFLKGRGQFVVVLNRDLFGEKGAEFVQVALLDNDDAMKLEMQQEVATRLAGCYAESRGTSLDYTALKKVIQKYVDGLQRYGTGWIDKKTTFLRQIKGLIANMEKQLERCTDAVERSKICQKIREMKDGLNGVVPQHAF